MELSRGVEPFDPTLEQIDDYKERFDYFCIAHGITEGKQKALFLTRIGQTMYLKLKTWVSPKKLSELSLDEIVAQLNQLYAEDANLRPRSSGRTACTPPVAITYRRP